MNRMFFAAVTAFFLNGTICLASGSETICVPPVSGDATGALRAAIDRARLFKGKPVLIRLEQGDYHLYRESGSAVVYYVSNTASEEENPDPTKHIGLWLKDLKNVTIDGGGARLVTHGEMTTFVVDGCENIVLRNFSLTAADPSVPEMTVLDVGDNYLTARVHPDSQYKIEDGKFRWEGHGWSFAGGIAQNFNPQTNVTNRCDSPMDRLVRAIELDSGIVRFNYSRRPNAYAGEVFQMRDAIRDEVCGFIHRSKNVCLEDLNIHFLGNFGIVGQYSENLTYNRIKCEPEWGHGRTCAGFADFVQMSGCKGKLKITNSRFEGAHDDPINIHGTHLQITEYVSPNQIKVRFMHGQSFGFEAFFKGDQIELVDANTLLCLQKATVKQAEALDRYEILLTLDTEVSPGLSDKWVVVENVSWTPEVEITHNYFSRTPTRGILVTTRKKVVIANNVFYRTPMSAILIADDARSWYESGPVRDVTIRENIFIECGAPVIAVAPENDRYEGAVHQNIRILNNRFVLNSDQAISVRSTDGLTVSGNYFVADHPIDTANLIRTKNCNAFSFSGNRINP